MSFRIPALRRKPKFQRTKIMAEQSNAGTSSQKSHESKYHHHHHDHDHDHHHHHSHVSEEEDNIMDLPTVPSLFTSLPLIKDDPETDSSHAQAETVEACLPFLSLAHVIDPSVDLNSHGVPKMRRPKHQAYLQYMLESKYPAGFVGLDPSRPWTFYWCLNGMSLLGTDVSKYSDRLVSTLTPIQHPKGGFGGGYGQLAHTATTYAAVLSLVTVGGEALDMIDRRSMWQWLGRMKQKNGGFTVCEGGEEDIRGVYCSLTIISLLNLPLELPPDSPARVTGSETFLTGIGEWISRCQSYEGGIAGYPGNEAHGAYTFCGLACLCLMGIPSEIVPKYLDVQALLKWLSARQKAPDSGFAGRTNKLVDGCYSHWVGGCWSLLTAALSPSPHVNQNLWSREGLARYILCCAQEPRRKDEKPNSRRGGFRDKPGKSVDGYHTMYCLAGLGAAQFVSEPGEVKAGESPLDVAYNWKIAEKAEGPWDDDDLVKAVHPVFVVSIEKALACRKHFVENFGFR